MNVDSFIGRAIVAMGLSVFPTSQGTASMTVQCKDGATVRMSSTVLLIDNGTVIGDDNKVVGNNNTIHGDRCSAVGKNNTIVGRGARSAESELGRSGSLDLSALCPPPRFNRPERIPGGIMMFHDAGQAEDHNAAVNPATGCLEERRPRRAARRPPRIADSDEKKVAKPAKRSASPAAKRSNRKRREHDD